MGPGRLPYGWIVVGALSITETVSWGILYYGFPVLLRPMEADLGFSRVQVTGAFSVGMGVAALAALPVGRWIDRHGARALMTLGSCLAAALLLAWSRVESLAALYAVWALMGLALAATLYEPAFAALVGWFRTGHRDRALMTVTVAGALASTIFMPLEAWLIDRLGWRGALVTLAGLLGLVTIPLHALVLRRPPGGPGPGPEPHAESPRASLTLGEAYRTTIFWILGAAFLIGNFATSSVTVHLIPYLSDRGYSPALAALMIGWMGAMQLVSRLLFTPIAARWGYRALTATIFVAQAAGIAQLALATRLPTLAPMVVTYGAANGMATLARATLIAEVFGPRHYGSISGAIALGSNGARAVAPVGASLLTLALGGYERFFGLLAGALVLAGIAVSVSSAGGHARRPR